MNPRTDREIATWPVDDLEDCMDEDMEDDTFLDDFDQPDIGDERDLDFDTPPQPKFLTAKQRVEVLREEQWLKSLTADFECWDDIEGFSDCYVEELSH